MYRANGLLLDIDLSSGCHSILACQDHGQGILPSRKPMGPIPGSEVIVRSMVFVRESMIKCVSRKQGTLRSR